MSNKNNKNTSGEAPVTTALSAKPSPEVSVTGALTPDQEQALKNEHKRIRKIVVLHKDGSKSVCYCKYPDRNVVALAMSKRDQAKVLEAGEAVLDNCFVAGDPEIKKDDNLRVAAAMECYALLDFLEASSEEL